MTAVALRPPEISIVMPTVSWSGTFEPCARKILELMDRDQCPAELVVALDGEHRTPPAWLLRPGVTVVSTGVRSGPAVARNRAAETATGGILLFVDADVELADGAIDIVRRRFREDTDLVALFGSYDDEPSAPGTASQFRNLLHHYTHMSHPGRATTFWAGCGAMRTCGFRKVGGFDGRYRFPCIEDIELGVRVSDHGGRIELEPQLRCKHHKAWTLRSMVHTDVVFRATPWTRMMLRRQRMPACLAIDWRNRACGALTVAALVTTVPAAVLTWIAPGLGAIAWAILAACLAGVFLMNLPFYRLCFRKRGASFAAASFPLHLLFFAYSSLAFAAVVLHAKLGGLAGDDPSRSGATPDAAVPRSLEPAP